MHFSVGILAAFAGALSALAAPSNVIGAAYFMTNDVHGNWIIAHSIDSTGQVTFASKTYTGGTGGRMITYSGPGVDALLGQGGVIQDRGHLYSVNAASNTVSMFKIDSSDPTKLTLVGKPVYNGMEFPNAIAASKTTGNICVTYSGQVNGVECFKPTKSGLKPISNTARDLKLVNQTTPASFMYNPAGASALFSEDGSKFYAIIKGQHGPLGAHIDPGTRGWISAFDVAKDGSLSSSFTNSQVPAPGLLPFGAVNIPGANALLVVDPSSGAEIFDFSNGDTASIQTITIPTNEMICWIAYAPTQGNYFMTDFDVGQVIEVSVDPKTLKLTYVQSIPLGTFTNPIDNAIGTIKGNDFLYQLAPNSTELAVLAIKPNGKSEFIQQYNWAAAMANANAVYDINYTQGMAVYIKN